MHDVIFVLPPFYTGATPNLTLGLLKSVFSAAGVKSKVIYANLLFESRVNGDLYEKTCAPFGYHDIMESLFAEYAFPEKAESVYSFRHSFVWSSPVVAGFERLVKPYIDDTVRLISAERPSFVYFENYLKQTTSSIAIAKAVRRNYPTATIVFGGYQSGSPFSERLLSVTDAIDYIIDGDPEPVLHDLYAALSEKTRKPEAARIIRSPSVTDLDSLPYPDYSDYYDQVSSYGLSGMKTHLRIEASRGCGHGKCVFCGFGRSGGKQRVKSAKRFGDELAHLASRYPSRDIIITDYRMPRSYMNDFFGQFGKPDHVENIFCQTGTDPGFGDLKKMKSSGVVSFQAGIESLHDGILARIGKGTDAAGNIRFLRDCKTLGMIPLWNFLHRVPGDRADDYETMARDIIPYIVHLRPPHSVRPIYIQKGSPMFDEASRLPIRNLVPYEVYRRVYPGFAADDLALFFNGDYDHAMDNDPSVSACLDALRVWKRLWETETPPALVFATRWKRTVIRDTRDPDNPATHRITGAHIDLLLKTIDGAYVGSTQESGALEYLMKRKFILRIGDTLVSLVENMRGR